MLSGKAYDTVTLTRFPGAVQATVVPQSVKVAGGGLGVYQVVVTVMLLVPLMPGYPRF